MKGTARTSQRKPPVPKQLRKTSPRRSQSGHGGDGPSASASAAISPETPPVRQGSSHPNVRTMKSPIVTKSSKPENFPAKAAPSGGQNVSEVSAAVLVGEADFSLQTSPGKAASSSSPGSAMPFAQSTPDSFLGALGVEESGIYTATNDDLLDFGDFDSAMKTPYTTTQASRDTSESSFDVANELSRMNISIQSDVDLSTGGSAYLHNQGRLGTQPQDGNTLSGGQRHVKEDGTCNLPAGSHLTEEGEEGDGVGVGDEDEDDSESEASFAQIACDNGSDDNKAIMLDDDIMLDSQTRPTSASNNAPNSNNCEKSLQDLENDFLELDQGDSRNENLYDSSLQSRHVEMIHGLHAPNDHRDDGSNDHRDDRLELVDEEVDESSYPSAMDLPSKSHEHVISELARTVDNLRDGFQSRENDLKQKLSSHKGVVLNLYETHSDIRATLREVCESLCDELGEIEAIVDEEEMESDRIDVDLSQGGDNSKEALYRQISDLQSENSRLHSTLQSEGGSGSGSLAEESSTIESLRQHAREVVDEYDSLLGDYSDAKEKINELNELLDSRQAEHDTLVAKLRDELDGMKSQHDAAAQAAAFNVEEKNKLMEEVVELTGAVRSLSRQTSRASLEMIGDHPSLSSSTNPSHNASGIDLIGGNPDVYGEAVSMSVEEALDEVEHSCLSQRRAGGQGEGEGEGEAGQPPNPANLHDQALAAATDADVGKAMIMIDRAEHDRVMDDLSDMKKKLATAEASYSKLADMHTQLNDERIDFEAQDATLKKLVEDMSEKLKAQEFELFSLQQTLDSERSAAGLRVLAAETAAADAKQELANIKLKIVGRRESKDFEDSLFYSVDNELQSQGMQTPKVHAQSNGDVHDDVNISTKTPWSALSTASMSSVDLETMQELSTLIDEHEKLLHDHQTLKEASFSQITESGGKIATLEQILSKEREKVSNLQSAMKSTKDASAQEVAGAREEAQRTVQAADGLRSDHDKLKREYKRVRSERERFKKTASEMAGHVNTLKSTLEEVRTVLQAKSQNEIKMQARIAMLETQSNKSQMMNITKEGSSLDKKISESLERGFASIDDYVKQTEDHGRIATRIGSEAQHPAVSPTRAAAELRAQELYHECQALKVKLETSQVSYSELMKANSTVKLDMSATRNQVEALRAQLATSKEAARLESTVLKQTLRDIHQVMNHQRGKLTEAEKKTKSLEQSLEKAHTQLQNERERHSPPARAQPINSPSAVDQSAVDQEFAKAFADSENILKDKLVSLEYIYGNQKEKLQIQNLQVQSENRVATSILDVYDDCVDEVVTFVRRFQSRASTVSEGEAGMKSANSGADEDQRGSGESKSPAAAQIPSDGNHVPEPSESTFCAPVSIPSNKDAESAALEQEREKSSDLEYLKKMNAITESLQTELASLKKMSKMSIPRKISISSKGTPQSASIAERARVYSLNTIPTLPGEHARVQYTSPQRSPQRSPDASPRSRATSHPISSNAVSPRQRFASNPISSNAVSPRQRMTSQPSDSDAITIFDGFAKEVTELVQTSIGSTKDAYTALKRDLLKIEKALFLKEDEVQYLQKLNEDLSVTKKASREKLSQLKSEMADLYARFEHMKAECETTEEQKRDAEMAIESSVEEIEALDEKVELLKTQMKQRKKEYAQELKKAREEHASEMKGLRSAVQTQLAQKDHDSALLLSQKEKELDRLNAQYARVMEMVKSSDLSDDMKLTASAASASEMSLKPSASAMSMRASQDTISTNEVPGRSSEIDRTILELSMFEDIPGYVNNPPEVFMSRIGSAESIAKRSKQDQTFDTKAYTRKYPFSDIDEGTEPREVIMLKDIHDLVLQLQAAQEQIVELEAAKNCVDGSDMNSCDVRESSKNGGALPDGDVLGYDIADINKTGTRSPPDSATLPPAVTEEVPAAVGGEEMEEMQEGNVHILEGTILSHISAEAADTDTDTDAHRST